MGSARMRGGMRGGRGAGAAVVAVALAWLGCTGEDPPSTSGDTVADLCDELCTKVLSTCNEGAKQMFRDTAQCVESCQALDPGVAGSTTGNTIRCRIAQVDARDCNGAGVLGGGKCGQRCDGYCRVAATACAALPEAQRPYRNEADCVETCDGQLRFDPTATEGANQPFVGEDTLNCRTPHLLFALSDPQTHCGHLGVRSPPCSGASPADAGGSSNVDAGGSTPTDAGGD